MAGIILVLSVMFIIIIIFDLFDFQFIKKINTIIVNYHGRILISSGIIIIIILVLFFIPDNNVVDQVKQARQNTANKNYQQAITNYDQALVNWSGNQDYPFNKNKIEEELTNVKQTYFKILISQFNKLLQDNKFEAARKKLKRADQIGRAHV